MKALYLAILLLFSAASAARTECRLALVLAMDVSRSVDRDDFAVQTEGLALALEDATVQAAFLHPGDEVRLAVFQWSGKTHQELLSDWHPVLTAADLAEVAARVRQARWPEQRQLTALGEALAFGHGLLAQAPDCKRQVIDVAGDGQVNDGRPLSRVYGALDWTGITVNGLAIRAHEQGLLRWFQANLIRGPGAFVEGVDRPSEFPAAIRRKLIREVTEALAGLGVPSGPEFPTARDG